MTPALAVISAVPLHGIGGRGDPAVPVWLAAYAAGSAVAVSFFGLAAFWSSARFEEPAGGRALPAVLARVVGSRTLRLGLRALTLAALLLWLAAGWIGPDDADGNLAPTWLYAWFWVGLVPLSVLLGPVWRAVNPVRTLASAAGRVAGVRPRPLPDRWAHWPAFAGLGAFAWLELVPEWSAEPRVVAAFGTAWVLVHGAAGTWFGPQWFGRGEGFEVYSGLLARLSPLSRDEDGRLLLRSPMVHLAGLRPDRSLTAVICLLLGSTGFDGLSRSRPWRHATAGLDGVAHLLAYSLGLVACVALVMLVFAAATGAAARHRTRGGLPQGGMGRRFAHSLVPIVVGYAVAHYATFAVTQGQLGYLLATDPFGRGWDLLGTGGSAEVDHAVMSTALISLVQVGAIVAGHVVGVVAAHDRAVATFPRRSLRPAQYPLLAAMVAFTAGGIVLVTAP
ncbi:hypothetical protein [Oryzihumus leptocrescens]|uniref:Fenitrothion hydrolase n=1 Tax=Oryzihumus leptocrescens TaxID=297536 RepID=A0A542ZN09_9MICO|nr:hypothetical protein [Oryzihumus leptocrescens]TQL61774.1 hypothetical protein FB474_3193 [Oryzihumus leptocrescens]